MEIIGLDLHKRESQLAIKAEDGTITDHRIVTSRAHHHRLHHTGERLFAHAILIRRSTSHRAAVVVLAFAGTRM